MKFKAGDRISKQWPREFNKRGIVIDSGGIPLPPDRTILVILDKMANESYEYNDQEIELEHIYNSPLYKALT